MLKKIRKSGLLSALLCVIAYCVASDIKGSPSMPNIVKLLDSAINIIRSADFYVIIRQKKG